MMYLVGGAARVGKTTLCQQLSTLHGYPTLSAEEETEATLAAEPTPEQIRKGEPEKE
jgi:hypothetical protein